MEKVIHYCWFGGNPLPKMVKKCIKSWKKYLPGFEIKRWDESNFDINACPFIKEAYEKKKWAFVSDYVRMSALYNEGGIYFDTDMEVKKNIDFLMDNEIFIGKEDSGYIATGVVGVKNKKDKHIGEILKVYENFEHFDEGKMYDYASPKIITKEFNKYDMKTIENGIEVYDGCIYVYPREYFYPLSYDHQNNIFTDKMCMVHYYSGTWTPKSEQFIMKLHRRFGKKWGNRIYNFLHIFSNIKHKLVWKFNDRKGRILFWASVHLHINKRLNKIREILNKQRESEYIVIHHPDWIGVKNSTKDNFKYTLDLREIHTEKEAKLIAEVINDSKKKMVIFNGLAFGWDNIAKELKKLNKDIVIKILWHGSHALLSEYYDWTVFNIVLELYNSNTVDELGFVKKSMYDFYKMKGYNVSFVMNTVKIDNPEKYKDKNRKEGRLKVGLYSSGDRWVKNSFNQISAISLIENAVMDAIPLGDTTRTMARNFGLEYTGECNHVSRDEMLKRIANNDINSYVTFTECAPLIPLESLELGVPCITGDNHHYFEGTELERYLVVSKEDNIIEIYNKILFAEKNRDKIIEEYKKWKPQYDIKAEESVKHFLEVRKK